MDEKYISDLYNQLGGQSKFGSFDSFKDVITTDDSYIKDFYNAFKDKLGSYDSFYSLVKKQAEPDQKKPTTPVSLDDAPQAIKDFSKSLSIESIFPETKKPEVKTPEQPDMFPGGVKPKIEQPIPTEEATIVEPYEPYAAKRAKVLTEIKSDPSFNQKTSDEKENFINQKLVEAGAADQVVIDMENRYKEQRKAEIELNLLNAQNTDDGATKKDIYFNGKTYKDTNVYNYNNTDYAIINGDEDYVAKYKDGKWEAVTGSEKTDFVQSTKDRILDNPKNVFDALFPSSQEQLYKPSVLKYLYEMKRDDPNAFKEISRQALEFRGKGTFYKADKFVKPALAIITNPSGFAQSIAEESLQPDTPVNMANPTIQKLKKGLIENALQSEVGNKTDDFDVLVKRSGGSDAFGKYYGLKTQLEKEPNPLYKARIEEAINTSFGPEQIKDLDKASQYYNDITSADEKLKYAYAGIVKEAYKEDVAQKLQDDLANDPNNSWYENLGYALRDAGKVSWNTFAKSAASTLSMLKYVDYDNKYGAVDRWVDSITEAGDNLQGKVANRTLYKDGEWDLYALAPLVSQAVTYMYLFGKGGNAFSKTGLGFNTGTFVSSMAMTSNDYYQQAKGKMSDAEASIFALTASALTSGLELISPGEKIWGKSGLLKMETSEAIKRFAKGEKLNFIFKDALKEMGAESLQEVSQDIGDRIMYGAANTFLGDNKFDTQYKFGDFIETVAATALATGISGGFRAIKTKDSEREEVLNKLASNSNTLKTALDAIQANMDSGLISKEKADGLIDDLVSRNKVLNDMPQDWSLSKKAKMLQLSDEIIALTGERYIKTDEGTTTLYPKTFEGGTKTFWSKEPQGTPASKQKADELQAQFLELVQKPNSYFEYSDIPANTENLTDEEREQIKAQADQVKAGDPAPIESILSKDGTPEEKAAKIDAIANEVPEDTSNVITEEEIKKKNQEAESKIKRKDLFEGVGVFSNELGGSGENSVPTSHSEINGIEFVQYSNPKTGIVDVIATGTSENDFVGYYRLYENGKPTNKWSSKFENQSRNKEDFKTMISGVQAMLPKGHEYTEKTSISTDGLRVWNQQLQRGYELQYDNDGKLITSEVAINGDAIVNELGIPVEKGSFNNIKVTSNTEFKKVKEALLPYLQKFNLNESNIRLENGTVLIDLPVLKKSENKSENKPATKPESVPVSNPNQTPENGESNKKEEAHGEKANVLTPSQEDENAGAGKSAPVLFIDGKENKNPIINQVSNKLQDKQVDVTKENISKDIEDKIATLNTVRTQLQDRNKQPKVSPEQKSSNEEKIADLTKKIDLLNNARLSVKEAKNIELKTILTPKENATKERSQPEGNRNSPEQSREKQDQEKEVVQVKSNVDVSRIFDRLLKDEHETDDYGIHGLIYDWGAEYNPDTENLEWTDTRSGTGKQRRSKKEFINDILSGKMEEDIPGAKDFILKVKETILSELKPKQENPVEKPKEEPKEQPKEEEGDIKNIRSIDDYKRLIKWAIPGLTEAQVDALAMQAEALKNFAVKKELGLTEAEAWDNTQGMLTKDRNVVGITEQEEQSGRGVADVANGTTMYMSAADMSTALHEPHHHFLSLIFKLADKGNEKAKSMLKTIRSFATSEEGKKFLERMWTPEEIERRKIVPGGYLQTQELFATSAEKYFMEGKRAGFSDAMNKVFESFKTFLDDIYNAFLNSFTPNIYNRRPDRIPSTIQLSGEMRDLFDAIYGKEEVEKDFGPKVYTQKEAIRELKKLQLSHVKGLAMGANQLDGTYISTEPVNRYAKDSPAYNVTVNIKAPLVVTNDLGLVSLRTDVLKANISSFDKSDFAPGVIVGNNNTIEDLNRDGNLKLSKLVTAQLRNEGYDSVYFPSMSNQEGELVVFDQYYVEVVNKNGEKEVHDFATKERAEQWLQSKGLSLKNKNNKIHQRFTIGKKLDKNGQKIPNAKPGERQIGFAEFVSNWNSKNDISFMGKNDEPLRRLLEAIARNKIVVSTKSMKELYPDLRPGVESREFESRKWLTDSYPLNSGKRAYTVDTIAEQIYLELESEFGNIFDQGDVLDIVMTAIHDNPSRFKMYESYKDLVSKYTEEVDEEEIRHRAEQEAEQEFLENQRYEEAALEAVIATHSGMPEFNLSDEEFAKMYDEFVDPLTGEINEEAAFQSLPVEIFNQLNRYANERRFNKEGELEVPDSKESAPDEVAPDLTGVQKQEEEKLEPIQDQLEKALIEAPKEEAPKVPEIPTGKIEFNRGEQEEINLDELLGDDALLQYLFQPGAEEPTVSKLTRDEVKSRIVDITDWSDAMKMLTDAYGEYIPVYHAASEEGHKSISKHGLKSSKVSNYKLFGETNGFYIQIGKSDYVSSNRPYLYEAKVPVSIISENSRIDQDGLMDESELSEIVGFDVEELDTDTRDFINAVVSNGYNLDGIEFLMDNELSENGIPEIDFKEVKDEDIEKGIWKPKQIAEQNLFQPIGSLGAANLKNATSVLSDLQKARDMEAERKDPLTIKIATGWERGIDRLWRYEAQEIEPKLGTYRAGIDLGSSYSNEKEARLADVIQDGEILQAYPDMKETKVKFLRVNNSYYDQEADTIVLSYLTRFNDKEAETDLVHEIQHAIQVREGFAVGANKDIADLVLRMKRAGVRTMKDLYAKREELKSDMNKLLGLISSRESHPEYPGKQEELDVLNERLNKVEDEWYDLIRPYTYTELHDAYRSVAGEVEARNAELRRWMTPGEKREMLLSLTEDVNRNQQTVLNSSLGISGFNIDTSAPLFKTRDENPIGFQYDTDKLARERFDIPNLLKIGKGSDRTVFRLPDGKVLKVAHSARGLEQNIHEGNGSDIIPEVYERGLNYVVVDDVPRIKASDRVPLYDTETGVETGQTELAGNMMKELSQFNQRDYEQHNDRLQEVVRKYGLSDIFNYDVLWGDFAAMRNWGYKDGYPVHIDAGTFGGIPMLNRYRGKKNLSDSEFRSIYYQSRDAKRRQGDKDKYTLFQPGADGFEDVVNGFYSPLERKINTTKYETLPAKQWLDKFGNSDEAKWTGLRQWLSVQTGNISKSEIREFLKENRVEIKEVERGGEASESEIDTFLADESGQGMTREEAREYLKNDEENLQPKFERSDLILGGERNNYKEIIVTFPINELKKDYDSVYSEVTSKEKELLSALEPIDKRSNEIYGKKYYQLDSSEKMEVEFSFYMENDKIPFENLRKIQKELQEKKDEYFRLDKHKDDLFRSEHYPEHPNLLVHLRMDTRADSKGNKVLFLEEIQSDWGQKGKREGFSNTTPTHFQRLINERANISDSLNMGLSEEYKRNLKIVRSEGLVKDGDTGDWFKPSTDTEMSNKDNIVDVNSLSQNVQNAIKYLDGTLSGIKAKRKRLEAIDKEIEDLNIDGPPPAPFVTDTASWVKLGLKVALKEAVKQGADKIAWTTGEQQVGRYEDALRKQVDRIDTYKRISADTPSVHVIASKYGVQVFDQIIPINGKKIIGGKEVALEDVVGKEIANKIRNSEEKQQRFDGDSLTIGGKGMIGFYGSPTEGKQGIVGEVAKKVFGQEPKTTKINTGEKIVAKSNITKDDLTTLIEDDAEMVKFSREARDTIRWIEKNWKEGEPLSSVLSRANNKMIEKEIFDYFDAKKEKLISEQPSIDITPELKEQVERGLPLFQPGPDGLVNEERTDKLVNVISKLVPNGIYTIDDIGNYLESKGYAQYLPLLPEAYMKFRDTYPLSTEVKNSLSNGNTINQFRERISGKPNTGTEEKPVQLGRGLPGSNATESRRRPPIRIADEANLPTIERDFVVDGQYDIDENQRFGVNLALNRFNNGGKAFLLADGAGVGKTREMIAIANEIANSTGKKVLIVTEKKTILQDNFAKDAKAMGVDMNRFETGTYTELADGKIGNDDYAVAIYDEAHNLKNLLSKRSMAKAKVKADHNLYATATPMDKVQHAIYFISELIDRPIDEIWKELGLTVEIKKDKEGNDYYNFTTDKGPEYFMDKILSLRSEAVRKGAIIRREYPFFGETENKRMQMGEELSKEVSKVDSIHQERIDNAKSIVTAMIANEEIRKYGGTFDTVYKRVERTKEREIEQKVKEFVKKESENRLQNIDKLNETTKFNEIYKAVKKDLAEGRQSVVVGVYAGDGNVRAGSEKSKYGFFAKTIPAKDALLNRLYDKLISDGVSVARIYGGNEKDSYNREQDLFQTGKAKVVLITAKSGGTGINLDDSVGDAPRTMHIATSEYSGSITQQIYGRVSRRNTKTPAKVISYFYENNIADNNRERKSLEKQEVIRNIVAGKEDLDRSTIQDEAMEIKPTEERKPEKVKRFWFEDLPNNEFTVLGDTFEFKDMLKEMGATPNRPRGGGWGGWKFPGDMKDAVKQAIMDKNPKILFGPEPLFQPSLEQELDNNIERLNNRLVSLNRNYEATKKDLAKRAAAASKTDLFGTPQTGNLFDDRVGLNEAETAARKLLGEIKNEMELIKREISNLENKRGQARDADQSQLSLFEPPKVYSKKKKANPNQTDLFSSHVEGDYNPTEDTPYKTTVRGIWSERNYLPFNGTAKVKDHNDVANIMSLLESASVEHFFAIHVDANGDSHIQMISIGGPTSTVVSVNAIASGVSHFGTKKLYLIHNHPSGKMRASPQDIGITKKMSNMLELIDPTIEMEHVIVDTYKNEYVLLSRFGIEEGVMKRKVSEGGTPLSFHQFDMVEVLSEPLGVISNSADAVKAIQQWRFSATPKSAMILMNHSLEIIANIKIQDTELAKIRKEQKSSATDQTVFASYIVREATKIPTATSIIIYGNTPLKGTRFASFQNTIKGISEFSLLDVVQFNSSEGVQGAYISAADTGVLGEVQEKYQTNSVREPGSEPLFQPAAEDDLNDIGDIDEYINSAKEYLKDQKSEAEKTLEEIQNFKIIRGRQVTRETIETYEEFTGEKVPDIQRDKSKFELALSQLEMTDLISKYLLTSNYDIDSVVKALTEQPDATIRATMISAMKILAQRGIIRKEVADQLMRRYFADFASGLGESLNALRLVGGNSVITPDQQALTYAAIDEDFKKRIDSINKIMDEVNNGTKQDDGSVIIFANDEELIMSRAQIEELKAQVADLEKKLSEAPVSESKKEAISNKRKKDGIAKLAELKNRLTSKYGEDYANQMIEKIQQIADKC